MAIQNNCLDTFLLRTAAIKALLNQQTRQWRTKVRQSLRIAIMLGLLSQVYLNADLFAALPDGTMASAFAAPFDGWNLWLLYAGGVFGAVAVWYSHLAGKIMQSLQSPNKPFDR